MPANFSNTVAIPNSSGWAPAFLSSSPLSSSAGALTKIGGAENYSAQSQKTSAKNEATSSNAPDRNAFSTLLSSKKNTASDAEAQPYSRVPSASRVIKEKLVSAAVSREPVKPVDEKTSTEETSASDAVLAAAVWVLAQIHAKAASTANTDAQTDVSADVSAATAQQPINTAQAKETDGIAALLADDPSLFQDLLAQFQQKNSQQISGNTGEAAGDENADMTKLLERLTQLLNQSFNGEEKPLENTTEASDTLISQLQQFMHSLAQQHTTNASSADHKLGLIDNPSYGSALALLEKLSKTLENGPLSATSASDLMASANQLARKSLDRSITSTAIDATDRKQTDTLLQSLLQTTPSQNSATSDLKSFFNMLDTAQENKLSSEVSENINTLSNNGLFSHTPNNISSHDKVNTPDNGGVARFMPSASAFEPATDQVLVRIRNAAVGGANEIKIQLQPAELGRVEVQMSTGSDGKTGITITADNRQTLDMLQREARALESALRDIGLKTDAGGLNFNLRGGQQQDTRGGKHSGYTQVAAISSEDEAYYETTVSAWLSVQQGLDIRV